MTIIVKVRKKCTKCGELKMLNDFAWINKTNRYASWCKECVADRQRPVVAEPGDRKCGVEECPLREARGGFCSRHYKLNRKYGTPHVQGRASSTPGKSGAQRKAWVRAYKIEKGCADCGYNEHWAALDFDHLPGTLKVADIRSGASFGWVALLEEIMKCDVVCANCHRVRTVERNRKEVMPSGRK
jgi:hypothetical protein